MKNYQPKVLEACNALMSSIEESGFFKDNEIHDTSFAEEFICEKLTEKFIKGELDADEILFTEEEIEKYLNAILVGSVLLSLQEKGLIDSVADENGEDVFFLTEQGKEVSKKFKEEDE